MTADEIARRVVADGVAPACAAGCARFSTAWRAEVGGAGSFFDLASVTKPMTALAVALAGLDRARPLGELLPEIAGTASASVALELFLAHRAGLESHRDLHAPLLRGAPMDGPEALRTAAEARRPDAAGTPPDEGFPPVYSDLGYVLAGAALARAVGARDAGEAIARLVLEPLGLATQAGTIRELEARGVCGPFEPTEDAAWRGGQIRGEVHDENAWALTVRGGSGHAGIFATASAVVTFGAAVLDLLAGRGGTFAGADLEWMVRERPGGTLRAGFDGKSVAGSSAGERMGPRAIGHLGFTGTSLWIDPDANVLVTLLTNRVCPTRDHAAIRQTRPWAHDALVLRAVELSSSSP
jgi:CubicO group peptidase (beta-lactamase class C family)